MPPKTLDEFLGPNFRPGAEGSLPTEAKVRPAANFRTFAVTIYPGRTDVADGYFTPAKPSRSRPALT